MGEARVAVERGTEAMLSCVEAAEERRASMLQKTMQRMVRQAV